MDGRKQKNAQLKIISTFLSPNIFLYCVLRVVCVPSLSLALSRRHVRFLYHLMLRLMSCHWGVICNFTVSFFISVQHACNICVSCYISLSCCASVMLSCRVLSPRDGPGSTRQKQKPRLLGVRQAGGVHRKPRVRKADTGEGEGGD